jgi:hypothetical protein
MMPYESEVLRERYRALLEEDGTITPQEGRVLRQLDKAERRGG